MTMLYCRNCRREVKRPFRPTHEQMHCDDCGGGLSVPVKPGARRATRRTCEHCGDEYEATQEFTSYTRKFCSPRCSGAAQAARAAKSYPPREVVIRLYQDEGLSDVELGKRFGRSYQWAFKVRQHYGIAGHSLSRPRKKLSQKSDRARWNVKLKGEQNCRNCGAARGLQLHHAIPRSMSRAAKYDLRNGVTLCGRCHLGWHRRSVTLFRDIFTDHEWAYISSVELTGQRIEAWLEKRYPVREPHSVHVERCQRGHAFDAENTYVDPAGKRHCRACRHLRSRGRHLDQPEYRTERAA